MNFELVKTTRHIIDRFPCFVIDQVNGNRDEAHLTLCSDCAILDRRLPFGVLLSCSLIAAILVSKRSEIYKRVSCAGRATMEILHVFRELYQLSIRQISVDAAETGLSMVPLPPSMNGGIPERVCHCLFGQGTLCSYFVTPAP